MGLNEEGGEGFGPKVSRYDFEPWAGVAYVLDANLPPDHFYRGMDHVFHLGVGTDVQLRLFWLNLTVADRQFLKAMFIGFE
jgi:hypothetical protein